MARPILFGAAYSVYVRAVRLALEEKGVDYDQEEVDIFAEGGPPAGHLARHPFGRIPAFEHDGFRLYEASAIARYVDEAFPGPALQPSGPRQRARMNQAIGVLDAYAYRTLVWDIFVERVRKPARGLRPDESLIATAVAKAETCLDALAAIMGDGPWLAGAQLTLADTHAAPMVVYLRLAPEGRTLIDARPTLAEWWSRMKRRPSLGATRSPME